MSIPRVLVTSESVQPGDQAHEVLQQAGFQIEYGYARKNRTEEELIDLRKGVCGVVVGTDPYTPRVLNAQPDLRVIARAGVGYDTIDVPAATARRIVICTNPGVNRHAVSEYTFALMLACFGGSGRAWLR